MWKIIAIPNTRAYTLPEVIEAGFFGGIMEAICGGHTLEKMLTEMTSNKKNGGKNGSSLYRLISRLYGASFLMNISTRPLMIAFLNLGLAIGDKISEKIKAEPLSLSSVFCRAISTGVVSTPVSFVSDVFVFNSISGNVSSQYLIDRYLSPLGRQLVVSTAIRNCFFSLGPYASYPSIDNELKKTPFFKSSDDKNFSRKAIAIMSGGVLSAFLSHPFHVSSVRQHTDLKPQSLLCTIGQMQKEKTLWKGLNLRIVRLGLLSVVPVYAIDWYQTEVIAKK